MLTFPTCALMSLHSIFTIRNLIQRDLKWSQLEPGASLYYTSFSRTNSKSWMPFLCIFFDLEFTERIPPLLFHFSIAYKIQSAQISIWHLCTHFHLSYCCRVLFTHSLWIYFQTHQIVHGWQDVCHQIHQQLITQGKFHFIQVKTILLRLFHRRSFEATYVM